MIKDKLKLVRDVNIAARFQGNSPNRRRDETEGHEQALWSSKALPMVEIKVELKASSENLNRTQVFPTPESPINSNLNK